MLLVRGGLSVLNGFVKELHEQVGHLRGSTSASDSFRALRSQCLREKTGMSKKAQ